MNDLPFRVKIDFNEQAIRKQQITYFNRLWLKKTPEYIKYLLLLIGFIYMLDSFRGRFFTLLEYFHFVKIYILIYMLIMLAFYIYQRIELKNKLNHLIKNEKSLDGNHTIIEFGEEYLRFETKNYDIKYNWNLISYIIEKNSIIIYIKMIAPFEYLIDKEETPKYDAIAEIIKAKSKKYKA